MSDEIDDELASDPDLMAEIVDVMNVAREANGAPFLNDMPGFAPPAFAVTDDAAAEIESVRAELAQVYADLEGDHEEARDWADSVVAGLIKAVRS